MTQLTSDQIQTQLSQTLPQWQYDPVEKQIRREFQFKDFYQCMAFVNALAFYAHRNNHHPDLVLGYNYCQVNFSTHDAGGVTAQDMACAKEADLLQ